MLSKVPWNIIGPAAAATIIILLVVFWFMLRWKKLEKPTSAPSNPPKDINTVNKKTLCFDHQGRIASNETAVKMIGEQLKTANENNRKDHKDLFTKIEDLGTKVITEIHKANEKT